MRNELQAAVEYFEDQLELVRRYAEGYPDKDNYTALADIYTTALDTTLSALRDALQRQPDPKTGLVPCGCGGQGLYEGAYLDEEVPSSYRVSLSCIECGISTIAYEYEQEAMKAWNTAMGWKGGAE